MSWADILYASLSPHAPNIASVDQKPPNNKIYKDMKIHLKVFTLLQKPNCSTGETNYTDIKFQKKCSVDPRLDCMGPLIYGLFTIG